VWVPAVDEEADHRTNWHIVKVGSSWEGSRLRRPPWWRQSITTRFSCRSRQHQTRTCECTRRPWRLVRGVHGDTVNGDIELEIGAGSGVGNYVVRVVRAAAGGEPVSTLELDVEGVLNRRDLLEATVLASAVVRREVSAAEQPVRDVGRQLFEALFTGPVYGMYRASLGVAQQRGKRLRVVLRLTAPELAALPWETLFDPETGTYLCRQEPLVRHVPAPYTPGPLEVRPPLRILGLVASPRGLPALDVDAEKGRLAEALAEPVADGRIELVWVPQATWGGVHSRLLAGEWHVLHFVGHGDYDARADEGVLALVGGDGRADLVEADRLADLLGEAQPAPRLVVLNSCSSGQTGVRDLFSGTAAALARSGINAVAAMQFAVSDTAAIAFARGFYTAIASGRGVDEAARSGRIAILGAPGSLEWVTPVLYLRGQATQLFTFIAPPAGGHETPSEQQSSLGNSSPAATQQEKTQRRTATTESPEPARLPEVSDEEALRRAWRGQIRIDKIGRKGYDTEVLLKLTHEEHTLVARWGSIRDYLKLDGQTIESSLGEPLDDIHTFTISDGPSQFVAQVELQASPGGRNRHYKILRVGVDGQLVPLILQQSRTGVTINPLF
jgi:CHAT domain